MLRKAINNLKKFLSNAKLQLIIEYKIEYTCKQEKEQMSFS